MARYTRRIETRPGGARRLCWSPGTRREPGSRLADASAISSFPNRETVSLYGLAQLTRLPDLAPLTKLRRLELGNCAASRIGSRSARHRASENSSSDARRVEVAAELAGQRIVAERQADEQGDFIASSSRIRKRKTDSAWVDTPWGGNLGDYETLSGIRVPTAGEAYWELPEDRYVYFRARVRSLQLDG